MSHQARFSRPVGNPLAGHTDDDWRERGACRGMPAEKHSEIFYPHHPDGLEQLTRASVWCNGCPVRDACHELGMTINRGRPDEWGIYAGLGPAGRNLLDRQRREDAA